MFISSTDYRARIVSLVSQSEAIDIAVAFWGEGASTLLTGPGKRFRILCNLTSGGTNPMEIEALLEDKHDVLHLEDLHAKVVVGDRLAIVGSANFSTNGLNIQGNEFDGWQEAGYATDKTEDLQQMREWFETQWKRGSKITPRIIEQAQANWAKRCANRVPMSSNHKSVLSMTPAELEGRNIFVALWRGDPSPEAQSESTLVLDQQEDVSPAKDTMNWDIFEDWDEIKVGQTVIPVYVGTKGRIKVKGAYEVLFTHSKKREQALNRGELMELKMCFKLKDVAGLPFTDVDCQNLASLIKQSGKVNEFINAGTPLVPLGAFVTKI